jgi:predicted transcriptional regulator
MSTHVNETTETGDTDPSAQLDVLGDECARTILVATSEGPQTAKELTSRTDSSSATVYRRINDLLEGGLLAECIQFDDDGTHTTAYEAIVDRVHVKIDDTGIVVSMTTD